jgi:S1-C subfamily serine protease
MRREQPQPAGGFGATDGHRDPSAAGGDDRARRSLWTDAPASPPTGAVDQSPVPRGGETSTAPPPPGPGNRRNSRPTWWPGALAGALAALAVLALAVAVGLVGGRTAAGPTLRPPVQLRGEPLDIQGVIQAVQPGVVSISVEGVRGAPGRQQLVAGAGSGMVIDPGGLVLTNHHVVAGATSMTVMLADGRQVPADLVGSVPSSDVALIQLRDVEGLRTVELGESSALQVGDDVVAVGNALNLGASPTVTTGIVSALNRTITAPGGVSLESLIQTDAAINQGNSGGPLVNAVGQVIGINTAIAGGAENIGFALSIDSVKPLIEELRTGGGEVRGGAYLGIGTADLDDVFPEALERLGIDRDSGAFVIEVQRGTAADEAGLQPGDVIVAIGDESIEQAGEVSGAIGRLSPGDRVEIGFVRDGEERTVTVTLGSRGVGD